MLSADVQQFVLDQRLGFVATVRPDGSPNLSPKGTTIVWDDDHLMFADIASPQTVENLRLDPRVEINVVDPIVRKGYRFRGTGVVHRDGPDYERGLQLLRDRGSMTPRRAHPLDRDRHGHRGAPPRLARLRRRHPASPRSSPAGLAHFNDLHEGPE